MLEVKRFHGILLLLYLNIDSSNAECTMYMVHILSREVLMGVGDGVASVIMLTFTKRPGPHADFYKEARPPC